MIAEDYLMVWDLWSRVRENDGSLSYAYSEMRLENARKWNIRMNKESRTTAKSDATSGRHFKNKSMQLCSFGSEVIGRFFLLCLMFISLYDFVIEKTYFRWSQNTSKSTERS